jgi:hypothetical protein
MPDKFEVLVRDSSYAVVLLYNEGTRDFELVDLPPSNTAGFAERGLSFAGVIGVVAGHARIALASPIEDERVVDAFLSRVEALLARKSETAWLDRLWSLPDTRN